ncbi:MAG: SMC-Scp complex subunit ScpB [Anaerolineaceae bacterium]|nr:SMC-Scp complex subunit ScpB [Anaerolineaceae bacterium]
MAGRHLDAIVEAILFASDEALSVERIAGALQRKDATPSAIRQAVADLNRQYRDTERTFEIAEVARGYKLMTLPEYNNYIRKILRGRSRDRISQAALETLAVVAYRQPVTRAEVENIRGVEAGPMLRTLVDRGLIRIVGRDESLGHPLLYGTTKQFLEVFGLRDLDSLPRIEELARATPELALENEDEGQGESGEAPDEVATSGEVQQAMADLAAEGESPAESESAEGGQSDQADDSIIQLSNHLDEQGEPAEGENPPSP